MATVAMMLGGAVLNATTFIGGSYLAKYFSGVDSLAEKKRHDIGFGKISEGLCEVSRKSRKTT